MQAARAFFDSVHLAIRNARNAQRSFSPDFVLAEKWEKCLFCHFWAGKCQKKYGGIKVSFLAENYLPLLNCE